MRPDKSLDNNIRLNKIFFKDSKERGWKFDVLEARDTLEPIATL